VAAPALDPELLEAVREDPQGFLCEAERLKAENSLSDYGSLMWKTLEPRQPLVRGRSWDAICDHLEAVAAGHIPRLLMNVPPGFSKSLLSDVFFPTWVWGPRDMPDKRFVGFSYAQALTRRDSRKAKILLQSPIYRRNWGDRFKLVSFADSLYHTNHHGFKLATSVGGVGMGERGDFLIVDDPNNVKTVESDVIRDDILFWFSEVLPTRLNDIDKSAIVVIQQRTHESDVSGLILREELGYEWLCYDDRTEVLTPAGWTLFRDLPRSALVMGVDPVTLAGRWERPTGHLRKRYQGPVIEYSSMTADLVVTPDHRMVYADSNDGPGTWRVRSAEDLPQDFYLPQALGSWEGVDKPVRLGGRIWDPRTYAEFLGWYLSEGNASVSGGYTSIAQNIGPKAERIREILERSPFPFRYNERPDGRRAYFTIGSKALARSLRPLGSSWTKMAPRALLEMGPENLWAFLEAYIDGDGHRGGIRGDRPSISSRSRGMIDDLQEAALKVGWASSAVTRAQHGEPMHFLTLRRSKKPGRPRKSWSKIGKRHTTRRDYDGEVHCVSVPSTALVVRRNGRVSISGNCLPMEFTPGRRCFTTVPRKGVPRRRVRLVHTQDLPIPTWLDAKTPIPDGAEKVGPVRLLTSQDWRKRKDQLLAPERFSRQAVEKKLKAPLRAFGGSYAESSQLDQSPTPRGGGMFQKKDFQLIEFSELPPGLAFCRGYDLAASEDASSAYSANTKIAVLDGNVYISDADRMKGTPGKVETWMEDTAEIDGYGVVIDFPQDPGQAGKSQKSYLAGKLQGYEVHSSTETGSKEARARTLAAQSENGNLYLVRGPWTATFIAEATRFPRSDFKDLVDAASRAYARAILIEGQDVVPSAPQIIRGG